MLNNDDPLQMQRDVDEFVRLIEREWHHPLEDGYNPDVTFMAHLWEPLRCGVVSLATRPGLQEVFDLS